LKQCSGIGNHETDCLVERRASDGAEFGQWRSKQRCALAESDGGTVGRLLRQLAHKQIKKQISVIRAFVHLAQEGKCDLMSFDVPGFSPNPTLPYGWARIGQTHCVEPESHREPVNVLGAWQTNQL
jgi:hypothetical protein